VRDQRVTVCGPAASSATLTVVCLSNLAMGEMEIDIRPDATVQELVDRLRRLGRLAVAEPGASWKVLNLRAGTRLTARQTLKEGDVRFKDFLYVRCRCDTPLDGSGSAQLKTPRRTGEFSGAPVRRVLQPSTRKDTDAHHAQLCVPPPQYGGLKYARAATPHTAD
jgi:hypothetical protein